MAHYSLMPRPLLEKQRVEIMSLAIVDITWMFFRTARDEKLVGAWEHGRSSPNAHTKAVTPQTIETLNFYYLCTPVSLSSSSLVASLSHSQLSSHQ